MSFSPFNFVIPAFIRDALTMSSTQDNSQHEDRGSVSLCTKDSIQQNHNLNGDVSDGNSDDSSVSVSTSGVSSLVPHTEKERSCHTDLSEQSVKNPLKRIRDNSPDYSHKKHCPDKTLTPSQIFFGFSNYKSYQTSLRQKSKRYYKHESNTTTNLSCNSDTLKTSSSRDLHLKSAAKDIFRNMEKYNSSSYLYGSYHSKPYVFKRGAKDECPPPTFSPQLCLGRARVSYQSLSHNPSCSNLSQTYDDNTQHCSDIQNSTAKSSEEVLLTTKDNKLSSDIDTEKIVAAVVAGEQSAPKLTDISPESPPAAFNFSKPLSASASSARLKDLLSASTECNSSGSHSQTMKSKLVSTGTITDLCELQRQDTLLLYETGASKEDINKWLNSTNDASIPKMRSATTSVYSDDDFHTGKYLKSFHSKSNQVGIRSSPSRLRVWRCETCLLENPLTSLICPSCSTPKRLHTFSRCRVESPAYSAPLQANAPNISRDEVEVPSSESNKLPPIPELVSVDLPDLISPALNLPLTTTSSSTSSHQMPKFMPLSSSTTDQAITSTSSSIVNTEPSPLPSGGFAFPGISTLKHPSNVVASPSTSVPPLFNSLSQSGSVFPSIVPFSSNSQNAVVIASTSPVSDFSSSILSANPIQPSVTSTISSPFNTISTPSISFPSLPQSMSSSQPIRPMFNFSSSAASLNFGTSTFNSSVAPITSSQQSLQPTFQFGSQKRTASVSQPPLTSFPSTTPLFPSVMNNNPVSLLQQDPSMESNDGPPPKQSNAFSFNAAKPQQPSVSLKLGNSQSAPHLSVLAGQIDASQQNNLFSPATSMTSRTIKKARRRIKP